jgi:hypothetical protein
MEANMRGTVTRFPVRRPDVSAPDVQKMIESLCRLSTHVDVFVKQTHVFSEKVAAVNEACKKARTIMDHF